MMLKRVVGSLVALGFAGSALAITGSSATGYVSVSEQVTNLGSNHYQYTYTFDNVGVASGLWYIGVYSDYVFSTISGVSTSLSGATFGTAAASSGFSDTNNDPTGFSSAIYAFTGVNSASNIAEGQTATLSFQATGSNNSGAKLIFAEAINSSTSNDSDGIIFSFVGATPPTPAPEPKLMVLLGVAGLGIAFARRRTA